MKKFFKEFKQFISRGNILDLAIGVIIGGAFSAIVTALTNKVIMPCINWLLSLGGNGLDSAYTFLKKVYTVDALGNPIVDLANSIYIDWGAFITAILNFLIIALTLFIAMKVAMKSNQILLKVGEKTVKDIKKYTFTKAEKKERAQNGISYKNRDQAIAYFEEKERLEAEKKAEEEKQKKLAEEEAKKNSTEYLLKEIRDLLKKQK